MEGAASSSDQPPDRLGEAIERLIHIEDKLDGFAARQDARFAEVRERLAHAEERLDHLLARLPQRQARPVAFLHVPKAAGTSFAAALVAAAGPRCAVGGFDRCLFGGFADFASFAPAQRRDVYMSFQEISPFCDMLAGHFSLSSISGWAPDAAVVMLMREPFSRLLSHWTFWRAQAGAHAGTLGTWNEVLACAQRRFLDFLAAPAVACQTDNVVTRMLLWPHELIPDDDFIAPARDKTVLAAAAARLAGLACVNVIENPALAEDMAAWLRRPFEMRRLNETACVPASLRTDLAAELTPAARSAWGERTRLDRVLWARVCRRVMPDVDAAAMAEAVLAGAVARYRALLAG